MLHEFCPFSREAGAPETPIQPAYTWAYLGSSSLGPHHDAVRQALNIHPLLAPWVPALGEEERLRKRLQAAIDAFKDERIRWFIGRSRALVDSGLIGLDKMDQLVRYLMRDEIERHLILRELEENGPLTAPELSERTGVELDRVREHLNVMCVVGEVLRQGSEGEPSFSLAAPLREIMEERRICPCETVVALLHRLLGLWGGGSSGQEG